MIKKSARFDFNWLLQITQLRRLVAESHRWLIASGGKQATNNVTHHHTHMHMTPQQRTILLQQCP